MYHVGATLGYMSFHDSPTSFLTSLPVPLRQAPKCKLDVGSAESAVRCQLP